MKDSPSADDQIADCLTPGAQESFILKAGAGAGKTRALVTSVRNALEIHEANFAASGAKVAVITYTRAARDEIKDRLAFNPRVYVSTIHSFAWDLIRHHPAAIRLLREAKLTRQIEDLKAKESKGRAGAASVDRKRRITRYSDLLRQLPSVKTFRYSPDSDIPGHGDLNHQDVIDFFAELLQTKPLLAKILVAKYPILFIDEVQDTSKLIIPALLQVEASHRGDFTLGFFGDMMQRIYLDGVVDLPSLIPSRWRVPRINENNRSGSRIVQLANAIREPVDGDVQTPKLIETGFVRLFKANAASDRTEVENAVRERMARLTSDNLWSSDNIDRSRDEVKTLVLEHALAASRLGFRDFSDCFAANRQQDALYGQGAQANSLTNFLGAVAEVLSAIQAKQLWKADNLLTRIRTDSIRFRETQRAPKTLESTSQDIVNSRASARQLMELVTTQESIAFIDLLHHIRRTQLFDFPVQLNDILERDEVTQVEIDTTDDDPGTGITAAWLAGLRLEWSQFMSYYDYIMGHSSIDTHQGVKGLEFQRVMLILDDTAAKGNLFSYDKLLGTKELSPVDLANIDAKRENSIDRTRRLLYVSCTRAIQSLAIVHYVEDCGRTDTMPGVNALFRREEIELVP